MGLSIKLLPAVVHGEKGKSSTTRGVGGVNGATDGVENRNRLVGDMPDMVNIDASGPGDIQNMNSQSQASIDRRPGPARRIRKAYDENREDGAQNAQRIKGPL